ncbi:alpha/beta fold hydrolase [Jiangella muralis]|uniref:alpha/beta fold hydrolase n=1 Tax=Jiangella muralis TaxID=702383 RepID=UPI00069EC3A1|nr:alpha/beta hydrolase [Jiangella muralis]
MTTTAAAGLTHRLVRSPAGRIHLVEQGDGPLVLLLHGFPEGWYSWRHQLPALAAAGYRAVAIDLRGYGRSSRPGEVDAYRIGDLVEDNVAVVEALGERQAVIAGHDVGSVIAANSALIRPDVFRAVALLSVPYTPAGGPRPSDVFTRMVPPGHEFYVSYFQQPGRAESEIEPDVRGWLRGFYASLSAGTMPGPDAPPWALIRAGHAMRERFPDAQPDWLSDADLDVVAAEFERTGLTGALNRYRNFDQDWADLAGYAGAPITQPSLFVAGALDAAVVALAGAIDAFPTTLPGLGGSHLLDGAGHWIQQERPGEVSALLTRWLGSLPN